MYRSYAGDMDMGLVSLVDGCQPNLVFSRCLIGCCGREAGYGPAYQTVVELWIVSGVLLLGCSGSV
jgi:hypothetical protein